jgi:hypothetical protein
MTWTEIVDGKRVAIQGLMWNSHHVYRNGDMVKIHVALKEALEEANFKEITPDIEYPVKLGDIKGRYSWAHVDAMGLKESQRLYAAMTLTHSGKVFLLRAYLGQGRVLRLSWRDERSPMMYMERTTILPDGPFSVYLTELLNTFRDYWEEVDEADIDTH